MKLKDIVAEARSRLDDKAAPYLWSRDELVRWINEAVDEAALRARLIYDESSPLTRLTVGPERQTFPLSDRIFMVDRVILDSTGLDLDRTTQPEMDDVLPRWRNHTGTPISFIDEQAYLRLYPSPAAADAVQLAVWRLSRCPMLQDEDEPEIAPVHHMHLIEWVRYRAYSRHDSDTEDGKKSAEGLGLFTSIFGERPDANVRRKHRVKRFVTVRPEM